MQRVNKRAKQPFNEWLSQNYAKIILAVIGFLLLFPLYNYIKRQIAKTEAVSDEIAKETKYIENQNPINQRVKAAKITNRTDIIEAARGLAHHLGTMYSDSNKWYSVFDPRGWTENDKAAADLVIKQRLNYKLLEKLYFDVFTNSRNLTQDLLKYLDPDQLKRVQKFIKIG